MVSTNEARRARRRAMTIAAMVALVAGASTAQPSSTPSSNLSAMFGKSIAPFGRLVLHKATSRTPEQMEAFEAAHPKLDLKVPAYRPSIPMGLEAYRAIKKTLDAEARGGSKFTFANAAPPPAGPAKLFLKADGPSQTDTGDSSFPPDISGAVGGGQVVVVVNSTLNVYDRSGSALLHRSLAALVGASGAVAEPRVLYDPIWKRWIIVMIDVPNVAGAPNFWLAFSKTANARGAFWVYHETAGAAGGVWDYPMVGMTQDGLAFTGNYSLYGSFVGSTIFPIAKAAMYNGLPYATNTYVTNSVSGTIAPPIVLDANVDAYFVGADTSNGTIDLYKGTNLNNPNQFSFAIQMQIPAGVAVPPDAPQHNSTQMLDTLDGRFQAPSYQYGTTLWNITTTNVAGPYMFPSYYRLDTAHSTLAQQGFFYESNTSYDFNPSLAANTNDEIIVTWTATDPGSHNARIRYNGWQPGDPTEFITPGSLLATSGPALSGNTESGNLQTWGAYSAVALDSNSYAVCSGASNRRAAIFNERIVDRNTWGTEMGIVGFC